METVSSAASSDLTRLGSAFKWHRFTPTGHSNSWWLGIQQECKARQHGPACCHQNPRLHLPLHTSLPRPMLRAFKLLCLKLHLQERLKTFLRTTLKRLSLSEQLSGSYNATCMGVDLT